MKEKREILVISTEDLFNITNYFQGFRKTFGHGLIRKLEEKAIWLDKEIAEKDSNHKQLIGYTIIIDNEDDNIYAYQRAMNNQYKETRLQGKWSIGIGGHVEKIDSGFSPILDSVIREIDEEIEESGGYSYPELIGIINDDSDEVGKVHFGLIFYCVTNSKEIKPKDQEISEGKFLTYNDLLNICKKENMENWSKILIPEFKNYFNG